MIPATLLEESSVCYCVGVGEDITFDLALIERFGCQVFAFDPTPRAIQHVKATTSAVGSFHFYPVGLWSADGRLKFFAPQNPCHVSHSIVNLQGTTGYFEAECKRLSTIMRELEHTSLDLLKLDIEGAEYEVRGHAHGPDAGRSPGLRLRGDPSPRHDRHAARGGDALTFD